jgi:inosine-uridine nucleoside N-ribohydrolase
VILDTDIGFDVDDVWALAFLLRCPELDVKLVVTDSGNTHYSARVAAKLLSIAGREDVPVGIGIPQGDLPQTHAQWLGGYSLDDYPGEVHEIGVDALCETVMASDEPVTLICIGPIPNIAAALSQEPRLTDKSRFIGMHGSLRRGYLGAEKPAREYNVKAHPLAAQRVFATPWDKTITPLDTCGTVVLENKAFAAIRASDKPLTRAVMANHFGWFDAVADWPAFRDWDPKVQSSILYDTVAVYLAFADDYLMMEELPLIVTDDGKTLIDDTGEPVRCATAWKDYAAFEAMLVDRLV